MEVVSTLVVVASPCKALISKFWVWVVGALTKEFKSKDGVEVAFSVVPKSTFWVVFTFVVVAWKALISKFWVSVVEVVPKVLRSKVGVVVVIFSVVLKSTFWTVGIVSTSLVVVVCKALTSKVGVAVVDEFVKAFKSKDGVEIAFSDVLKLIFWTVVVVSTFVVVVDAWKALTSKFWVLVIDVVSRVFKSNEGAVVTFSVLLKSTFWTVGNVSTFVVVVAWKVLVSIWDLFAFKACICLLSKSFKSNVPDVWKVELVSWLVVVVCNALRSNPCALEEISMLGVARKLFKSKVGALSTGVEVWKVAASKVFVVETAFKSKEGDISAGVVDTVFKSVWKSLELTVVLNWASNPVGIVVSVVFFVWKVSNDTPPSTFVWVFWKELISKLVFASKVDAWASKFVVAPEVKTLTSKLTLLSAFVVWNANSLDEEVVVWIILLSVFEAEISNVCPWAVVCQALTLSNLPKLSLVSVIFGREKAAEAFVSNEVAVWKVLISTVELEEIAVVDWVWTWPVVASWIIRGKNFGGKVWVVFWILVEDVWNWPKESPAFPLSFEAWWSLVSLTALIVGSVSDTELDDWKLPKFCKPKALVELCTSAKDEVNEDWTPSTLDVILYFPNVVPSKALELKFPWFISLSIIK